jgi:hypothetical protein
MAVAAGSGRAPATAHGGGQRRRSRRLGELRRGGQMWANKRTCELSWVLRKIAGGLDGGEREQRALAPAAATMEAGGSGLARWERGGGLFYAAQRIQG